MGNLAYDGSALRISRAARKSAILVHDPAKPGPLRDQGQATGGTKMMPHKHPEGRVCAPGRQPGTGIRYDPENQL